MVIVPDDPVVGNRDPKDVACQVAQAGFPVSHGLAVDNPLLRPDLGFDLFQEAGGFHRITEFRSDDARQWFGVNEEVLARGEPPGFVGSEPATGDDEVQVWVKLKL